MKLKPIFTVAVIIAFGMSANTALANSKTKLTQPVSPTSVNIMKVKPILN